MKPLDLSVNALALDLRVPATRVSEIVHERRGISVDTALRLGIYFGTTPDFWMNLQKAYELETARRELLPKIHREVKRRPDETTLNQRNKVKRSA